MKNAFLPRIALAILLAGLSTSAMAHPQPGGAMHFTTGFLHPFSGIDHILAMLGVGIWATQLGGSALWKVPLAFVFMMAVGGALGMAGAPLPLVEFGIAGSVAVFGLLILFSARLPVAAGMALVGLFALFHGYAHGTAMPATASGLSYGAGFVAATLVLHAIGVATGLLAGRGLPARLLRLGGAAMVVAGGLLLAAL